MNLQHLKAILWLRWRMSSNQWRRAGAINAILTTFLVVSLIAASFLLFFATLIGGSVVMLTNEIEPDILMLTWDVIVAVFLFAWTIGLVAELQRSELLSLDRMLHLPLSLSGVFFLNYASSLLSLPIIMFLPGMCGLAIACVIANETAMLTIFPLLATFLFFVTALTYQLRGWLATLMQNKRRRKTIIVGLTLAIILLSQAPQLVTFSFIGHSSRQSERHSKQYREEVEELTRQLKAGEISGEENTRLMKEIEQRRQGRGAEANTRSYEQFVQYTLIGNKILPFGWLPYGVHAAAKGNAIPGLLASLGMIGIGGLSLWRSYATTMRFYTGTNSAPKRTVAKKKIGPAHPLGNMLESQVPFLSEHATGVALATFRSLVRAPESKIALMTPLILACVFGGIMVFGPGHKLRSVELGFVPPFIAIGVIGVTLFGLAQLMMNIFGMDRGGFRSFVLMPVRRQDVLLGKNLSVAPIAACISIVLIVALQCIFAMRFTHLVATLLQFVPAYLIFCLIGNTVSILAPLAVSAGSLKPAQPNFKTIVIQMLFMLLFPITLLPAFAALGAETAIVYATSVTWLPIYLVLSLGEAALVVWGYWTVIGWQGEWLQKRESRILESLASVPE